MITHIMAAAPAVNVEGGRILGTVGAGGIALALTVILIAGIREGKGASAAAGAAGAGGGGGKKGRIRKRLTSDQAQWTGIAAGTLYMAAGSIWTIGKSVSDAYAGIITNGGWGHAGMGAASLVLAAILYFRELAPGKAAFVGIVAAGVWAQSGGIWILPKMLILTGAHAMRLI